MTELSPTDESAAAQPSPDWPLGSQADVTDPLVKQALAPLDGLPGTPVAGHEAVYNDLHDQLRTALDTEPTSTDPASLKPTTPDPANSHPSDGGA
ncbi:hypothetical protein [Arthrobacter sp. OV608]|uniref:hypothetical protein n=1 Tax=Arthrobacter sp. OV608 TaxID=1882768 RepID=UPI0008BBFAF9|nr:hypothetical protein [Arthrobacter sp. OV608]SER00199.1 hypothetical protein SAMN05444745_11587 [Arthrobacter sp. OV608]